MRTLQETNELLDAHHDELGELFKTQCEDKYETDKNISHLYILFIFLCAIAAVGFGYAISNQIRLERKIQWIETELQMNTKQIDALVCELKENHYLDEARNCQLYDEYD